MSKKIKLSLAKHNEIGKFLLDQKYYLTALLLEITDAYSVNSEEYKLIVQELNINSKLRSALDSRVFKETRILGMSTNEKASIYYRGSGRTA